MFSDKVYKVGVYKDAIEWPDKCVCCFEPADTEMDVKCFNKLANGVDVGKTLSFSVPICSFCMGHIQKQKPSNFILITGIIIGILMLLAHLWLMGVIIIAITLILALTLSMVKSKAGSLIKDSCSGIDPTVTYYGHKFGRHLFNFSSEDYAIAFHKLNSDDPEIEYEETGFMSSYNDR